MRFLVTAAIALVVMVALGFISSCTDQPADGYHWYKAADRMSTYHWHVVGLDALRDQCNVHSPSLVPGACAQRYPASGICHVYSTYTEAEAKKFRPAGTFGGTTLFQHEVWDDPEKPTKGHCAGFDHREAYLRGPGA